MKDLGYHRTVNASDRCDCRRHGRRPDQGTGAGSLRESADVRGRAVVRTATAGVAGVAAAQVFDTEKASLKMIPMRPFWAIRMAISRLCFFDYNCPYCRRVKPEMEALLAADPNVRVVYREWPILGDGSVFAARAALASRNQGKYEEFHWAMMQLKERAEEASILRTAEDIGLDVAQLRRDMNGPEIEEHIQTSMRLAQSLGFSGTPSFVIGDSLAPGLIQADQMIELVDQARAAE